MDVAPDGSAWSTANVDAINFELDSTDSTPGIHIGGFYYEVASVEQAPLTTVDPRLHLIYLRKNR